MRTPRNWRPSLSTVLFGCTKHPTPEEQKQQEETDRMRLMQRMLEIEQQQMRAERDGGAPEGGIRDGAR
ncbi:MAG TPA: hypothetical protein VMI75_07610 [Polyangiaceae bacterium]|nr:hypothetical protein [Polyangiaceae bacterium]